MALAPDAVEVPTDNLSIEEVVDRLEATVRQRRQIDG
jgi:cytidylate kinase